MKYSEEKALKAFCIVWMRDDVRFCGGQDLMTMCPAWTYNL